MLVIHGRGGHSRVVADAARREHCVFTDDRDGTHPEPGDYYICAIGDGNVRERVGGNATVIHKTAAISDLDVTIGDGTYIGAQASVGPGAHLGEGVIINTSSVVEHDCTVGFYTHIAPGAVLCGGVSVGDHCHIGANAVVREGVYICNHVTVGCGAAVIKDIHEPGVYVGVPAVKRGNKGDAPGSAPAFVS